MIPRQGFTTDAHDNMIETYHYIHSYFGIPVYSLYSEPRIPTEQMLDGIDPTFVDLKDAGCKIYPNIYILTLLLEKCSNKAIEVIVPSDYNDKKSG